MRIYPVILCGGSGTRLWPASRPSRPKQFIALTGERSLFQDTAARLEGLEGAQPPIVVAGERHAAAIVRQLADMGAQGTVIAEPEGRDSAPAIAAAAAWIAQTDSQGVLAVFASDHHIPDAAAFRASVAAAARAAAQGRVVTFGVRPTSPSTAYGYIQPGAPLASAPGVHELTRFVEKPDAAKARDYIEAGYLWNSGNFVFAAQTLLDELTHHAPEVAAQAKLAVAQAAIDGVVVRLGEPFRTAPKISIDYAVMEKTDRAAVAPVSFAWSDLGAWDAVWAASQRDASGNAISGDALMIDSRDCLIRADGGGLVVGVGLKGIAIVSEPDAVLVCDLASSQSVKLVVERLNAASRPEADVPETRVLNRRGLAAWLDVTALPLWWSLGADHGRGGFIEALDQDGRPVEAPRRARVQARQIYVYADAARRGWRGPAIQAVEHGLDFFLQRYSRPDALFSARASPDGAPADPAATLYDQAFGLFALASAADALPERANALHSRALAILHTLRLSWAAPSGGFVEQGGVTAFQSNPHMHLLEAALAWSDRGGAVWETLAAELVELCLGRFIDPTTGGLREYFAADWSPSPGIAGRIVEPGHQFEWAWLLKRWAVRSGDIRADAAASRLYDIGVGGVDPARGVAVNALLDDFSVHDGAARLWPQTEWIKAAHIIGDQAGAQRAARALSLYLDVKTPGLWRDSLLEGGRFVDEPAPASSFYHIACAISETTGAAAP